MFINIRVSKLMEINQILQSEYQMGSSYDESSINDSEEIDSANIESAKRKFSSETLNDISATNHNEAAEFKNT